MSNRNKQLAKAIPVALLRRVANVATAREITTPVFSLYPFCGGRVMLSDRCYRPAAGDPAPLVVGGEVLITDVWAEPKGENTIVLEQLGALGRMLDLGACLIELFSQPPRLDEFRTCVLKQMALDQEEAQEAEREKRAEPAYPRLWVLSPGRPRDVIDKMSLHEMDQWPRGFWQGTEFNAFHLIVASELPRTPDTLFLRLLSPGDTFREAVHELATQAEHAWALDMLMPVLAAFRDQIPLDSLEVLSLP